MTALQLEKSRPDALSIGTKSVTMPSDSVHQTSRSIADRLAEIASPSPTFSGSREVGEGLDEALYDALANFKIRTANVAMHLDRDRRWRLFRQLDSLLAIEDWEADDAVPSIGSFSTFLRMLILLRPLRSPGLGATADGNLIATWTVENDRLTIECQPKDFVRWSLSATIDGERERSAAVTPLLRLQQVLRPYSPERWFGDGSAVPSA
jgi:hypothetical protein